MKTPTAEIAFYVRCAKSAGRNNVEIIARACREFGFDREAAIRGEIAKLDQQVPV